MTRASIPLWLKNNVSMISVGVKGGSAPPAGKFSEVVLRFLVSLLMKVPRQFVWHDNVSNTSIMALWHGGGYGGERIVDWAIAPTTGRGFIHFGDFK